jgi:peptide/nickel transport system permease protein
MGNYVIRRLVQAVPTLFLITGIVFLVVDFIPGNTAAVILGQGATPEHVASLSKQLGLDKPLPVRYGIWLKEILRGDLGKSAISKQPVWTLLGRALPVTLYLTLFSLLIALLISIPAGTIAALKRNSWADLICTTLALLGLSVPGFWLGIQFVYLFGAKLHWVPLQGYVSPRADFTESVKTMILPALTLGVFLAGPLTRYLRSSVLQTMSQEFVQVARAKGLSERKVLFRHILRTSLIPFVTAIGIQFGYLIGGAAVIETVFTLPGVGYLAVNAINDRDFAVVQGVVLVVATGFILINILVDMIYSLLDPRIRVGGSAGS